MTSKLITKKFLKLIIILVVIAGLSVTGFKIFNKGTEPTVATAESREEAVKVGDITIGFSGDGQAEIPVVNLDFEINGKLKDLHVKVGDEIKVGQILAQLDDTDYQKQLKVAETNYNKALLNRQQKEENIKLNLISEKQKLEDSAVKLEQAEMEYNTMLSLEEHYPKQDIEIKRMAVDTAKSAYEIQLEQYDALLNSNIELELEEINVENAKINLEVAQDDLRKTILHSPINATVLNIGYKLGETVSSVRETGQVTADTSHFMIVTDSDKVEVVVPVSEIDLANVALGQTIEVKFEAYEGETFTGEVTSIAALPKIDQSGLVTYDVRIELGEGIDRIKSGMTCSVAFILRQEKDVLIIPNKAVKMQDGVQIVKVKNPNEETKIRNIKTGLTDGRNVEVQEGLVAGETVLIE
ncbi:HlyD family secretion protein/membrane fusion protein, macrolide-specific efflux system [Anaerovirgula multivorans]|uniref:HlyD family secretion protein/membrane fusion protein, macrolide-specific efflux system n=1 Tax=Anaerovirgula multivorans TaxID=312168 RepID=A0A239FY40_9FIRM|nr:efflux RND transporter periplasmic adaptor subunit [Anaerovirgula multivorans]SNS61172.1 HlyD family secretion protein/membrane fusion protein, macrolide-specific efflux system [Anaerovirgula multivorans]